MAPKASGLLFILALGLMLRVGAAAAYRHTPQNDELAYRSIALSVVGGNGVVDGMGNRAMYNVGYPLFVLAPVYALLGENLVAIRLINVLLGLTTALCCDGKGGGPRHVRSTRRGGPMGALPAGDRLHSLHGQGEPAGAPYARRGVVRVAAVSRAVHRRRDAVRNPWG